jgi:hypothetical protein
MERKAFVPRVKDAGQGLVEAVFSTFGTPEAGPVDKDGDVTLPTAFEHGVTVPMSAYGHTTWQGALPVGKGTIRVERDRAVFDGVFFLSTQGGREHFETLRELGPLTQWSYGYDILDSAPGKVNGRPVRILKRLRVHEVSPVLVGAGVDTRTLALKGRGDAHDEAVQRELLAIRTKLTLDMADTTLERAKLQDEVRREFEKALLHYCEVTTGIDPHKRQAAEALARWCARDLGLDPPPILRWFEEEGEEERAYVARYGVRDWEGFAKITRHNGLARKTQGDAWVHAGLPFHTTLNVVAHELRHHKQFRSSDLVDDPEVDADRYAAIVAGLFASDN